MTLTSPLLSAVSGDLQVLQVTYSTVLKLETKRAKIIRQAPKLWGQHTDVLPQNGLKLLLLEATLDDEASAAVDGTIGTQLGEQISCHVLFGPLHALADLLDVGEDSFLLHIVSESHEMKDDNIVCLPCFLRGDTGEAGSCNSWSRSWRDLGSSEPAS